MILVTGATGFIGKRVVVRLVGAGHEVRCLVRPAYKERTLPPGIQVHLAAGDLADPPALRVAMHRVDAIIHLASIWIERDQRTFESVNVQGTQNLIEAAHEARVSRLIFLSYPNADRNSAYAFLRSKGLAEEAVKSSGLKYTILRPSWVYGPEDGWTTRMAMTLQSVPFAFPVAGDGQARVQPLWVDDLAVCIEQCASAPRTVGQTITLGGPGYFAVHDVLDVMAQILKTHRRKLHVRIPLARQIAKMMERTMLHPLLTTTQVDLLNVDTTTDLGSVSRNFGFEPSRFADSLDYLSNQPWRRRFWASFFSRY
jgi:NADH dehydrogenase